MPTEPDDAQIVPGRRSGKVIVTYRNQEMTLKAALAMAGNVVPYKTAYERIFRWNVSVRRAVEVPSRGARLGRSGW